MLNQEELQRNAVAFLVTLRRTEWADYRKYMTSDLMGIGPINQQALQTHLYELLDVQNETPTVEDFLTAWNTCIELGELVEPARVQPEVKVIVQQAPEKAKSEIERQAEIISREIALTKKQRRQEPTAQPNGPSLQEKARQQQKNNQDFQEFKSDLNLAQTFNFSGQVSRTVLDAKRAELVELVHKKWTTRRPDLKNEIDEKIRQYSTTAPSTSGGFTPLPLDADAETIRRSTPGQIRELIRRRQLAEAAKHGEPNHDAW